ncbi:MAG: CDGSH iron-sulfur domain-containing protein [Bdellovibrionales bacterium]|nr:CDGSH iron-sulfur domain-containing protein [Bdellovibrionales bacterium]
MKNDDLPKVALNKPIVLEMEAGEYWWCACGLSKNQPFCDGSHKGTDFSPKKFVLEENRKVAWCACKHTKKDCLCDGTHKNL